MKKYIFCIAILLLSSCVIKKDPVIANKPKYGNLQNMIELQNPNTRDVVFCIKDENKTAEECAVVFEKYGFVRIKNIPYKPAKYDLLQTDTYPTRRWRDGEKTPRW
ncbi:MAG: hypothetical protein R3Y43_05640 [Alphaproteobacteria bacterium]